MNSVGIEKFSAKTQKTHRLGFLVEYPSWSVESLGRILSQRRKSRIFENSIFNISQYPTKLNFDSRINSSFLYAVWNQLFIMQK